MDKQVDRGKYWHRVIALIGLGLALLIMNIDVMIINLVLPVIGQLFHAKLSSLQWINNIYGLSMASTVIFVGALADRYGHRLLFLWGVALFFIGSLLAGFAVSLPMIILGRFIQGGGMGAAFVMIFVLTMETFPKSQRGIAFGLLVIFTGGGQAIGPSLGGIMIHLLSWRWAFLINAPICAVSYAAVLFACQKDEGDRSVKMHYFSALLLTLVCFFILFAANQSQVLSPTVFWIILVPSVGFFIGLLVWQKRLKTPLISLDIFRNRVYVIVNLIRVVFQFCIGAFLFVVPLYLQNIEGFTPIFSGMVLVVMASALAISSPLSGKLSDAVGPEISVLIGKLCAFSGFFLLAFMPLQLSWILLLLSLVFIGLNSGITLTSTNYMAMHELPEKKKGVGFGIFIGSAFFFFSIGVAVTGYMLSKISLSHFYALLSEWQGGSEVISQINTVDQSNIQRLVNGADAIERLRQVLPKYGEILILFGKEAFLTAFRKVMALLASLTFLAVLLSTVLLKRWFSARHARV